ncbi:MAG: ABC transporter permease [Chloroflexota bacterium]
MKEALALDRPAEPVYQPGGRHRPVSLRWLWAVLVFVSVLVVWEALIAVFNLPATKLPHIATVLQEFVRRTGRGDVIGLVLLRNALVTFQEAIAGFIGGALLGLALAIAFAHSRLLSRAVFPYVIASQTVPILALAPMIVVAAGRAGAPPLVAKAIIAAYLTFFPVTVNMARGLTSVNQLSLDLMHSYAASRWTVLWKLRLPASLPYLFVALKISATAAIVGALIGELPVGSTQGMGVVILNAAQYTLMAQMWAAIITVSAMGMAFYLVVAGLERLVVPRAQPA